MIKNIRKWFAPIITALLYVIIVLVMAVTLKMVFKTDEYFWTTSLIGLFLMVSINYLWSPTGVEKGEAVQEVMDNKNIYNARANYIVDNQLMTKAKEFCAVVNDNEKKEYIKTMLSSVTLDLSIYEKYLNYTKLSKEEKEWFKSLSKKQIKMLNRLKNKPIRIKKLKVEHLIFGRKTRKSIVPVNKENLYLNLTIVGKAIFGFVLGAFMVFIVVSPRDGFGIAQVIQLLFWACSIVYNIFAAINNGYKRVVVFRNDYIVEKATRCAEFFEWAKIPLSQVDIKIEE